MNRKITIINLSEEKATYEVNVNKSKSRDWYYITIPKQVVERLKLSKGTRIRVTVEKVASEKL